MKILLVLLALSVATGEAATAERWHTVAYGETVSGIAKQHYGDFEHTELLLRFNQRGSPELKPGERLRIPYCTDHTVARGDNGSTLAKRYLGRVSAWEIVARLNGLVPEASLQPGQALTMPVIVPHTLARGDSLSGLAAAYYGDPGRGDWLQAFNGIADPQGLAVGQIVEVPLLGVRLADRVPEPVAVVVAKPQPIEQAPAPQAQVSNEPEADVEPEPDVELEADIEPEPDVEPEPEPEPKVPAWFPADYSLAEQAFRRGEFEVARVRVDELSARIEAIPIAEERSRVWRLAAFIGVAFDDRERACASYRAMRATGTADGFDADRVSPKIREVLAKCGRSAMNASEPQGQTPGPAGARGPDEP